MNNSWHRLIWSGAAIIGLLLLAAIVVRLLMDGPDPRPSGNSGLRSTAGANSASLNVEKVATKEFSLGNVSKDSAGGSSSPQLPPSSGLFLRLRAASDWRVFATEAVKDPNAGGVTYAAHAAHLCRMAKLAVMSTGTDWGAANLSYVAPEDPLVFSTRNASFENIKATCQGFSDHELSIERDIELADLAKAQADSLYKLRSEVKSALAVNDMRNRRSALAAVLENGDPLLLSETLPQLLLQRTGGGLSFWIDGKQVPVIESGDFSTVLAVLPCKFGLICDERSVEVVQACLGSTECYSDRLQLAMSKIPDARKAEFTSMLGRMEAHVRGKRVDLLLP